MKKEKESGKNILNEFTSQIITFYMLVMFTFYPLYMSEGYYNLGAYRFVLYRTVTSMMIILCTLSVGGMLLGKEKPQKGNIKKLLRDNFFSPYTFICLSLFTSFISFIFSVNKESCFFGLPGFNTGFLFELLVGISFIFISFYYVDSIIIWLAAFAGSGITFILAVLNRFYVYPIDVRLHDPEYISTIGQTNWFCGYMICFTALGIGFFILYEFSGKYRLPLYILLFIYNALVAAALWVAGSDMALLIYGIISFVMLGFAVKNRAYFIRYLITAFTFCITPEILYIFMFNIFPGRFQYFQEEDTVNSIIRSHICIYPAIIVALILIIELVRNQKKCKWNYSLLKLLYRIAVALMVLGAVAVVALIIRVTKSPETMGKLADISLLRFEDTWASFRGLTWKLSVKSFSLLPVFRKVIGVGSGCFYDYTYSVKEIVDVYDTYVFDEVMPNAHNEYLNVLIENGIIGWIVMLLLFITLGITLHKKAENNLYAAIAFAAFMAYVINLIVSFKTTVSTTYIFIFAAIAICTSRKRTQ